MRTHWRVHWTQITPKEAKEQLIVLPRADVRGPINEMGEPCPWPWEPQQLVGVPMGQYHCNYCGGMQIAGTEHSDWSNDLEDLAAVIECGGPIR